MANTYDNYYDIQPYRSFSDLERTEDIPDYGDPEEDFSDELLEAAQGLARLLRQQLPKLSLIRCWLAGLV